MTTPLSLACVLLAHSADAALVREAADAARGVGAQPVVVVLTPGTDAPDGVRVARVKAGATTISALRAGMALLTNSTARLALVWPLDAASGMVARDALTVLVDAARTHRAAVTAAQTDDLDRVPVVVARDAWLELVTIGEQGMGAVAARRGLWSVT